ncbi:MAG: SDR family oxidoreductase [Pirellulales bacterium]
MPFYRLVSFFKRAYLAMPTFENQCVVVTGASSGIGRALCLELASQRPKLVLAARDNAALEEVSQACQRLGAETLIVPTDVAQPDDCRRLMEAAAERFNGIDTLVNNAGIAAWARFAEVDDLGIFDRVMRVNYLGTVYCTHFALPHLRQSRGRLVIVASVAGLVSSPMYSAYAPTKAALFSFADALRIELLQENGCATVTVLAPDFVRSGIHQRAFDSHGQALGQTPWDESRFMTSEDCAKRMVRAMASRKRQAVLSWRGRQAPFAKAYVPWLLDRIVARVTRDWK